jgi:hypothetical protein
MGLDVVEWEDGPADWTPDIGWGEAAAEVDGTEGAAGAGADEVDARGVDEPEARGSAGVLGPGVGVAVGAEEDVPAGRSRTGRWGRVDFSLPDFLGLG